MNATSFLKKIFICALAASFAGRLSADVLETKNGARLVGKIQKISDGSISLKTDYAGEIAVKQSDVTSITTDAPISVRLKSGTVLQGTVVTDAGGVKISNAEGQLSTQVDKVAASWPAGAEDPAVAALRRHWAYEAAVDIAGKTGNSEQLGTAVSAKATLKTPEDTLQFYTAYDRQVVDKQKSADQFKAGVDYQDNFHGKLSWYVRDEGGFDRIKDIQLYDVAAFGLGYDVIKEPKHTLTTRAGLSYRYEGYSNPATPNVSAAGLDLELNHEWTIGWGKITNQIAYVPSFDDFSNFRFNHESAYEVPLISPIWKLRLGVSNDYNSKPGVGVEKLDTTYFTRLVLTWQ